MVLSDHPGHAVMPCHVAGLSQLLVRITVFSDGKHLPRCRVVVVEIVVDGVVEEGCGVALPDHALPRCRVVAVVGEDLRHGQDWSTLHLLDRDTLYKISYKFKYLHTIGLKTNFIILIIAGLRQLIFSLKVRLEMLIYVNPRMNISFSLVYRYAFLSFKVKLLPLLPLDSGTNIFYQFYLISRT